MHSARRFTVVVLMGAMVVSTVSGAAFAAKGGGGKGHRGAGGSGTFSLVLLNSTDGTPHWGQDVTFSVSSTATYSFVDLDCYQSGALVFHQGVGFYAGYPFSQIFTLKNWMWTAGAADCNATLYATNADGSGYTVLAPVMSIPVNA
jgi:hypothetical protein